MIKAAAAKLGVHKRTRALPGRLRACQIAGVKPTFTTLPAGQDPLAYIFSANLNRRDMTKGQEAMALAMIYPEPGERGRGKKSAAIKSAETSGFSGRRLNQARSVLHFSPELAQAVLAGITPLGAMLATEFWFPPTCRGCPLR